MPDTPSILEELPEVPRINFIDRFEAELVAHLENLDDIHDSINEKLNQVVKEQLHVKRILRAIGVEPPRARTVRAKTSSRNISSERLDRVRIVIARLARTIGPVDFEQITIRKEMGFNSAFMSQAFMLLRDEGFLRLSGQRGTRKYYRLTPAMEEKYGIAKSAA